MKKILFLGYSPIGDRIASIPYLMKMRDEGNEVYLLEYDEKGYKTNYSSKKDILKIMKNNNLYKDILFLPNYNKFKLILKFLYYIFKYASIFDEVYAPIKTQTTKLLGIIFGKKYKYAFKNLNDNIKYDNFVSGIFEKKDIDFQSYSKKLVFPCNGSYRATFGIDGPFVTIFIGPRTRSLNEIEWQKIMKFITNLNLNIILVGSLWREGWLQTTKDERIVNLLGKTNFEELCSIIKDAEFTISANGGIMWLCHLLNKKSISFSIVSGKITHPPVDGKTSFHIKNDDCKSPCEYTVSDDIYKKYGYKKCIYGKRECIIRENLRAVKIINLINILLTNTGK